MGAHEQVVSIPVRPHPATPKFQSDSNAIPTRRNAATRPTCLIPFMRYHSNNVYIVLKCSPCLSRRAPYSGSSAAVPLPVPWPDTYRYRTLPGTRYPVPVPGPTAITEPYSHLLHTGAGGKKISYYRVPGTKSQIAISKGTLVPVYIIGQPVPVLYQYRKVPCIPYRYGYRARK
jgi:hypothetical protein